MNVAAHQEKEKNEKTGKRRQADFKEAACYASAVVQKAARENVLCEGSARDNWDPWEGQQSC